MNTVLFDLDGTLLPMDLDDFMQAYFGAIGKKGAENGYDPKELVAGVWAGTKAMMKNDGTETNETRFWSTFAQVMGEHVLSDRDMFDSFYDNEFCRIGDAVTADPRTDRCVKLLRQKGYTVALATTPLFPKKATLERMRWAGLDPNDFALITTYEDYHFAKPTAGYFEEVVRNLGKSPADCLMVGNDMIEDMGAKQIGTDIFFLTDHLINKKNADVCAYRHGGFDELLTLLAALPDAE